MKRLGAILGLWSLVWTRDHDGQIRLRMVHKKKLKKDIFGMGEEGEFLFVYGVGYGCTPTRLLPGGERQSG